MLGRHRDRVLRAVVFAFSLVEVPLFLWRNRALFRNDLIYPLWHWSFGHTISGIDFGSRLYWPRRISLLYVPHQSSNPLLPRCWEHNVDAYTLSSRLPLYSTNIDAPRAQVLRFYVHAIAALWPGKHVLEHLEIYKTLSLATEPLRAGDPDADVEVEAFDYTGYVRLLNDDVGCDASLPPEVIRECERAVASRHPGFFDRPFVSLVLREKGRGLELHTAIRCTGPQENYREAVRWLTENGYHVVPGGETDPAVFADIPGVFALDGVDVEPRLLNLWAFSRCAFFIGQQSGAPVLADACGVPVLLTDAMPHRYGTFRRSDVILWKRLRERESGRVLSLVEIFRDHPDLALGYNFVTRGIEIEPNTPAEILDAVREVGSLLAGGLELTEEDELLAERFRALPLPSMHLAYHGNRTTLTLLRQLREELLAEASGPRLVGASAS